LNKLKKAEAEAIAAQKSEAKAEDKTAKQVAKTAKAQVAQAAETFNSFFVAETAQAELV